MKVYKFGGASIQDADGIRNVGKILQSRDTGPLILVVSAMGKTTNTLEEIAAYYFKNDKIPAKKLDRFHQQHLDCAAELFGEKTEPVKKALEELFSALDTQFEGSSHLSYDALYDQVVAFGELCSSRIVSDWLNFS